MEPAPAVPKPFRPWQIGIVFLVAVGLELAQGGTVAVVGGIAASVGGADPIAWFLSPAAIAAQVIASSAMLAALAVIASKLRGLAPGPALGLTSPRWGALAVGALGVLPMGILSDELTFVVGRLGGDLFDTAVLDQFARTFSSASAPWFVALTVAIAAGPALGEELLFRGLVLRSLSARLPGGLAVLLSAILFGAIHLDALQGMGALLIGLYLGFLALATGSLWPAIAAHALNNLLCALFARFDPSGAGSAFETGHPWPLVAASLAAAAAVVVALARMGSVSDRRPGSGEASQP